jgi:hypothetical protein
MPDMSLGDFIGHLTKVVATLEHEKHNEHEAMERAALLIENEAKKEIGHYQAGAGPFAGWAELADSTKDERVKQGFAENEPGLRTGEMRDSIDHVVGDREAVVGSNSENLERFELGTAKQPPRSVLGLAAVRKAPEVARILGMDLVQSLVGRGVFMGRLPIP